MRWCWDGLECTTDNAVGSTVSCDASESRSNLRIAHHLPRPSQEGSGTGAFSSFNAAFPRSHLPENLSGAFFRWRKRAFFTMFWTLRPTGFSSLGYSAITRSATSVGVSHRLRDVSKTSWTKL